MLVKEDLRDVLKGPDKEEITSSLMNKELDFDSPQEILDYLEMYIGPARGQWHDVFHEFLWFLRRKLHPSRSNEILLQFAKEYIKEYKDMSESLNESILDSYKTFFDIEFSGLGINEIFEIEGNRYIIDDINLGSRENVIEFTIKGIDTVEKLKLYIDSNTNQAFDIQKIIIPHG